LARCAAAFDAAAPASYLFGMRSSLLSLALAAALVLGCVGIEPGLAQDPGALDPDVADPSGPLPPLSEQPPAEPPAPRSLVPEQALPDAPDLPPALPKTLQANPQTAPKAAPAPKPPQDRETMLSELYAHLAQAQDAEQAAPIAKTIEGLWAFNDSPTISLLMARAAKAITDQNPALALKLLDAVVELSPDYAEGWSRRAFVYYMQSDTEHAAGDLRRALALDPNHYKSLEGLAHILRDSGQKKSALGAYQQLLRIYPFLPGAKDAAKDLSLEVEGQGI
jgi:tetratricopeptide (TPR) repeat protein